MLRFFYKNIILVMDMQTSLTVVMGFPSAKQLITFNLFEKTLIVQAFNYI